MTLVHWKEGTRDGDDPVYVYDVVNAIVDLCAAMIERAASAEDHSR